MNVPARTGLLTAGTVLAVVAAAASGGGAKAALPAPLGSVHPGSGDLSGVATLPLRVKVLGTLPNGKPRLTRTTPTGLSPAAIQSVYHLSGLTPTSGAGAGQIIAIVDAFHDPHALSDLNAFSTKYHFPTLSSCASLAQAGACFKQVEPASGTPRVNSGWVLEESLDIEWARAEAPGAKIVLVEAASSSFTSLFNAVAAANKLNATEVSLSWGGSESSGEISADAFLAHAGTFYTVSSGDSGHGAEYPAASPNVIAVGGTTLSGCSGTSCSGFKTETAWSGSGGGASAVEPIPGYQSGYTGPVFRAATIAALTGSKRAIPDVSFDANPSTGVSIFDSTKIQGQSGWFTVGGTSVGAPNWAGILAAGRAAGKTALQGDASIYKGGYSTNLRDIAVGTNGSCGTNCTAGAGYDLVTGLGSPTNYP